MNSESIQSQYGLWKVESHPGAIEYSHSVMSEIAAYVEDGFNRLTRGGLEEGGILLGTRSGMAIRIEAWRPIACEHARGPSFLLSPNDENALSKLLKECKTDPELKAYEALGWFHSHTRTEICLTDEDLQFYDRYFEYRWQVALVLKPRRHEHVRAGFFVRELAGRVRTGSSFLEFAIESAKPFVAQAKKNVPISIAAAQPAPVPLSAPVPGRKARRVQSPFSPKWLSLIAVLLMLLTAARILKVKWDNEPPPVLPVKVVDQLGTLQIEWDRTNKQVMEADSAEILIVDGTENIQKSLDRETVRQGAFRYVRGSEDVRIQLTLFSGGKPTAMEISRFIGLKGALAKDAVPDRAGKPNRDVAEENVRLREALRKETVRVQRLERTVRNLQDRLGIRRQ